jgi:hypothetical protein
MNRKWDVFNTFGYTEERLDKINAEWEDRLKQLNLNMDKQEDRDKYYFELGIFSDEITSRTRR